MGVRAEEALFHTESSRARVLVVMLVVAVAMAAVAQADQSSTPNALEDAYQWVPIHPRVRLRSNVQARPGPGCEIWFVGTDRGIYRGRRGTDGKEWKWRRFEPPRGLQPFDAVPGPRGDVYVKGTWKFPQGSTLLRLRTTEADGEWTDLKPPGMGPIFGISVTEGGTVWVTGEWREVFRLAPGGGWVREVTPLPLHNGQIEIFDDESGWISAHSQRRAALYFRKNGHWVVAARSTTGISGELLFATKEFALWRDGAVLLRIPAPLSTPREPTTRKMLRSAEDAVSFSSLEAGHTASAGRVLRRQSDGWRELHTADPVMVFRLFDLGQHGLFALGPDERLLELRKTASPEPEDPFSNWFRPEVAISPGDERIVGVSLTRMAGEDFIYFVSHEGPNMMVSVASMQQLSGDPLRVEKLQAISNRLGITGDEARNSWNHLYDTSAVIGDLNGDGREELFVVNMYGEDAFYRNVRDHHFVRWQMESGAGGRSQDMTNGACLLDADSDGDLDLYVTSVFAPDRLLVNSGAASFSDGTKASGIHTVDASETPRCVDLDGDGDTDIVVATWGRGLLIHENLGGTGRTPRFSTHRLFAGIENPAAEAPLSTTYFNSTAAADLDHDGLPELLVTAQVGCDRLLWNRGGLSFEERSDLLPVDQPCQVTFGASFLDIENDGDLDLMLTGKGGLRVYENREGRFSWVKPKGWEIDDRPVGRTVRGAIATDLDHDGDLDLLYGRDAVAPVQRENRTDDDRFIELAIDGPAANRSAIGATVRLYPAGKAGIASEMIAWRTVPPAGGYHSQGRRTAHFGGVDSGSSYDLVVDLPGAQRRVVRSITAPHAGRVSLTADRFLGTAVFWRTAHFLDDIWQRLWIGTALLLALALFGFGWILFRSVPPWPVWLAAFSTIPLGLLLLVAAPVDPGLPALSLSLVVPGVFGILWIALLRARATAKPLPELLVELDLALHAFRHNQTPRRVVDRLRFVLENLAGQPIEAGTGPSRLLAEDLLAHREVVLPELMAISRLAGAASLAADEWKSETRRQARLVWRMLSGLRQADGRTEAPAHRELVLSLERMDRLAKKTRAEVDSRLSIDLSESLSLYVVSRKELVPCAVEIIDSLPDGLRIRFMKPELHRLLDILLENAVQAMGGNDEPRVAIEAAEPSPGRARIRFTDEGPGVPPDKTEAIFRAGYTMREGGSGFGLFWARRTLERFGGSIRSVAAATGACFEIEFDVLGPAREAPAMEESA